MFALLSVLALEGNRGSLAASRGGRHGTVRVATKERRLDFGWGRHEAVRVANHREKFGLRMMSVPYSELERKRLRFSFSKEKKGKTTFRL